MPAIQQTPEKFVDDIRASILSCKSKEDPDYLDWSLYRDIMFYGYYLQKKHALIDFRSLLALVGTSDNGRLESTLGTLTTSQHPYIQNGKKATIRTQFSFTPEFISAIEKEKPEGLFFGPDSYYRMGENDFLPGEKITGIEFVKNINMINNLKDKEAQEQISKNTALLLVDSVLANVLSDISYTSISDTIFKIKYGNFQFVFGIYCTGETVTDFNEINKIENDINNKGGFNYNKLILIPSLSSDAAKRVDMITNFFCIWDLSFVAFVHLLSIHKNKVTPSSFSSIFDTNTINSHCFSEGEAIHKIIGHR